MARPAWRYALVAAIFVAVALIETKQAQVMDRAMGASIPFLVLLRFPIAYYAFWALATPLIVALARRLPLTQREWPRSIALHVAACMSLGTLHALYRAPMHSWVYPWFRSKMAEDFVSLTEYYFVGNLTNNLLLYAVVALIAYSIQYIRALQERELRSTQLEARLGEARLQALRMQIQPHFLFNTLNSITALMHKDVEAAENMMTDLSDLLRRTLETSQAHEVRVSEELDLLEPYLAIQRTRFQDRLTVVRLVDDEVLSAMLPNLTLHTLVENALRHGIAERSSGGVVRITIAREHDMLVLRVADNGPGLSVDVERAFDRGIGLRNTRERLERLYGKAFRFTLENQKEGGVAATIALPFHSAPLPTAPPEAMLV